LSKKLKEETEGRNWRKTLKEETEERKKLKEGRN
jgi:hypothetical protein